MYHYRKTRKIYAGYPKPASCPFCDLQASERVLRETKHAYLLANRTFYDVWELRNVVDHLMVVPKAHVHSLSELSDTAKLDIMNLIGEYESHDYNVYARAVRSVTRSVAHQHTHLIKTDRQNGRLLLHIRKPYLTIKF